MKTTGELTDILKNADDIEEVLEEEKGEFLPMKPGEYLCSLIREVGMKKSDVIRRSCLDRTYAYQILSGIKTPSRDKLVMFALGMRLSLDKTQEMLKKCGEAQLYAKNKRDAILIHAISYKLTVPEADDNLYNRDYNTLIVQKDNDSDDDF